MAGTDTSGVPRGLYPGRPKAQEKQLGVPGLAIVTLFSINMIFGSPRPEGLPREIVVLVGLGSFGLLLLGFYALFLRHCVTGTVFALGEEAWRTTKFLAPWLAVSLVSLFLGFLNRNDNNYLVGDFYKFTQAAMVFYLSYFTFRRRPDADLFLGVLAFLLAATALYSLLNSWTEIEAGLRLATRAAFFSPFVLPIQFYLLTKGPRLRGAVAHSIFLCVTIVSLIVSQWRGPILLGVVGLSTFWLVQRGRADARVRSLTLPVFVLVLVGVAVWHLVPSGLGGATQATIERFRAAAEAAQARHRDPDLIEVLGSRIPEVEAVTAEFRKAPARLLFGFGLGSQLETVHGINREWGTTHYIHLGSGEILFRAGVAGLASFLLLCFYFLRRFYQARADQPLAVLAVALGVQHGLSFLIASPFVSDTLVFAVYGMTLGAVERTRTERR